MVACRDVRLEFDFVVAVLSCLRTGRPSYALSKECGCKKRQEQGKQYCFCAESLIHNAVNSNCGANIGK